MRVVLDTNIVISGSLWSGSPHLALDLVRESKIQPIISEAMRDELKEVISRPKFAGRLETLGKTSQQVVEEYLQIAEVVESIPIPPVILEDPDDDKVLACAVSGKAAYVISGNIHLLKLGKYENITIWDVRHFLELFD